MVKSEKITPWHVDIGVEYDMVVRAASAVGLEVYTLAKRLHMDNRISHLGRMQDHGDENQQFHNWATRYSDVKG